MTDRRASNNPAGRTPIPLRERFMDKVSPEPTSGCWLWTANVRSGYGQISTGLNKQYETRYAHRVSYELFKGPSKRDHPLSGNNLYRTSEGYRACRECKRLSVVRKREC